MALFSLFFSLTARSLQSPGVIGRWNRHDIVAQSLVLDASQTNTFFPSPESSHRGFFIKSDHQPAYFFTAEHTRCFDEIRVMFAEYDNRKLIAGPVIVSVEDEAKQLAGFIEIGRDKGPTLILRNNGKEWSRPVVGNLSETITMKLVNSNSTSTLTLEGMESFPLLGDSFNVKRGHPSNRLSAQAYAPKMTAASESLD